MMNLKKMNSGFSLIELLITMAIMAILMSVAVASYQQFLQQTYRTEAILNLEKIAAEQEKFKFINNDYADEIAQLRLPIRADDYYGYRISKLARDTGCQADEMCFALFAFARRSPQMQDTGCTELKLQHNGQRWPLNCFE